MNPKSRKTKKRLMFLKGEDLYYFAYNILVLLNELNAKSMDSKFVDISKISFLIEFISDSRLSSAVYRAKLLKTRLNGPDHQSLQAVYSEGLLRRHIISRLFFAMERRGLVVLSQDPQTKVICVWIDDTRIPHGHFDPAIYHSEMENVKILRKISAKIKSMKLETMLSQIFQSSGVSTWRV